MEVDVVDAAGEHQVEVGLHLRQRSTEVLRQPGERLTTRQWFPRHMGCRRGILQHRHIAEVLPRLTRVGTQSLDAKIGESETLYLRDVDSGIEIQQVGRRTVRLVAHLDAMFVGPCHPLLGEILEQQVGERLAVVAEHLIAVVHHAQQFGQMLAQVVAAPLLEFIEERGSPVGTIHLVRVVEERVRVRDARRSEGLFETFQIVADGLTVEVVYDKAFTSGCGALYLLPRTAYVHGVGGITTYHSVLEDGLARCLFQGDVRAAERPARTTVHVNLNTQRMSDVLYRLQRLHPMGRQERDIVFVVALHAIERSDLHRSDTHTGILAEVPPQVLLVNGRAQPPPARARLRLRARRRPVRILCANEK